MINFFIKIGKVIEIYNFCYYDYDYFFSNRDYDYDYFLFSNRDYDYYFDC